MNLDLSKHLEFFSPMKLVKDEIHIIGCGAVGSNIAIQLTKLGCDNFYIWDFDTVDPHNVTNQVYNQNDIGKLKVDCLEQKMKEINPIVKITKLKKYTNQLLKGYIFTCVDSVELRHRIFTINQFNININIVIDGRIGLSTGQIYCVKWNNDDDVENLIELSNFKDNEAEIKFSACGTELNISPTVLITISYMISSFINILNKQQTPKIIYIDAFTYKVKAVY